MQKTGIAIAPAARKYLDRAICLWATITLMLYCNNALAAYQIWDLDNTTVFDYNWSNTSLTNQDITAIASFCIESITAGGTALPFNLQINDTETPGTLQITNTTTSDNLPVAFTVTANGSTFALTNPATYYGRYNASAVTGPGCGNAEIEATIQLGTSYPDPGIYDGQFDLTSQHIFLLFGFILWPVANDNISFSLMIEDLVRVSGLQDLNLNTASVSGDLTDSTDFCIFRNGPNSSVTLDARSDSAPNPGDSFNLTSLSGNIPYQLEFFAGASPVNTLTTAGTASTTLNGSNQKDCGGTGNHSVQIRVLESDWTAAPNDTYTDNITLTVTAN